MYVTCGQINKDLLKLVHNFKMDYIFRMKKENGFQNQKTQSK